MTNKNLDVDPLAIIFSSPIKLVRAYEMKCIGICFGSKIMQQKQIKFGTKLLSKDLLSVQSCVFFQSIDQQQCC